MLTADIMLAVRDLVAITDDAQLKRYLATAVREYDRHKPVIGTTEILTVIDQASYVLPANTMRVTEAIWYPSGYTVSADMFTVPYSTVPVSAPVDEATTVIDAMGKSARERRIRGEWNYANNLLWLYPIPVSANLPVTVSHHMRNALTGAGGAETYATIEDALVDAVIWLTAANILDGQAAGRAGEFDYVEGLTEVTKHYAAGNLKDEAVKYRKRALNLIS